MQTRQLYASVTATIAGTVYFDMPANSRIRSVDWCIVPVANLTDADYIVAEVSLSSSGLQTTNDAQGVIAKMGAEFELTTSGAVLSALNKQTFCDFPVVRGQRVYLNVVESGTSTWQVSAIIHFD